MLLAFVSATFFSPFLAFFEFSLSFCILSNTTFVAFAVLTVLSTFLTGCLFRRALSLVVSRNDTSGLSCNIARARRVKEKNRVLVVHVSDEDSCGGGGELTMVAYNGHVISGWQAIVRSVASSDCETKICFPTPYAYCSTSTYKSAYYYISIPKNYTPRRHAPAWSALMPYA